MKKILLIFLFISSYAYDVSVSILPQKFVIDYISNKTINVNVMVPKGGNPAIYSPRPNQLLSLKKSLVYFKIGVPFENAWLHKFTDINKNIKIVDFGKYIKRDKNPHIWLDPIFLISEAKVVYETLSQINPSKKLFYKHNFEKFKKEAWKVNDEIETKLSHLKDRRFIIFHPNLYYFAKRYKLIEIALEKDGKEPSFRYLLKIIRIAKQNGIKVIFTAPEFSQKSAKFLASKIDAQIVSFSALNYNIFKNLLRVTKILYDKNR